MSETVYPPPSKDLARKRRELVPTTQAAFDLGGHPKPANEGHLKTGQRK